MEQIFILSTIAAILLFQTEEKGVIISGGYDGYEPLKSTELLNRKTFKRCQLPKLATKRYRHTQVGNRTIGHVQGYIQKLDYNNS